MNPIDLMLVKAQPGARSSVRKHMARGRVIAEKIAERFPECQHPRQWRAKHLRWYLEAACARLSSATRYDHWRTVRVLAAALGRFRDWEPWLQGPWVRGGVGGRAPKLARRRRVDRTCSNESQIT